MASVAAAWDAGVEVRDGRLLLRPVAPRIVAIAVVVLGLVLLVLVASIDEESAWWGVPIVVAVIVTHAAFLRCQVIANGVRVCVRNKWRSFNIPVESIVAVDVVEVRRFYPPAPFYSGNIRGTRLLIGVLRLRDGGVVHVDALTDFRSPEGRPFTTATERRVAALDGWIFDAEPGQRSSCDGPAGAA